MLSSGHLIADDTNEASERWKPSADRSVASQQGTTMKDVTPFATTTSGNIDIQKELEIKEISQILRKDESVFVSAILLSLQLRHQQGNRRPRPALQTPPFRSRERFFQNK